MHPDSSRPPRPSYHAPCISSRFPCVRPVSPPTIRLLHAGADSQAIQCTGVGSSNNYAYLVTDEKSKDAVIIDPANPPE